MLNPLLRMRSGAIRVMSIQPCRLTIYNTDLKDNHIQVDGIFPAHYTFQQTSSFSNKHHESPTEKTYSIYAESVSGYKAISAYWNH